MFKDKIEADLIEALKNHDEIKLSTLRMLKSAIRNLEIQKQKDLEDAEVLPIIQSQIKSRRDSINLYKQGNREELAIKEENEIEILAKYLPEQITEDEIRLKVSEVITKTGASSMQDMGKVMGLIIQELKGKADPSLVSQIVKETLSK